MQTCTVLEMYIGYILIMQSGGWLLFIKSGHNSILWVLAQIDKFSVISITLYCACNSHMNYVDPFLTLHEIISISQMF